MDKYDKFIISQTNPSYYNNRLLIPDGTTFTYDTNTGDYIGDKPRYGDSNDKLVIISSESVDLIAKKLAPQYSIEFINDDTLINY